MVLVAEKYTQKMFPHREQKANRFLYAQMDRRTEHNFCWIWSGARICKRLNRPGIDSEDSITPAYVALRAGTTNNVVVPARQAGNRFLGS